MSWYPGFGKAQNCQRSDVLRFFVGSKLLFAIAVNHLILPGVEHGNGRGMELVLGSYRGNALRSKDAATWMKCGKTHTLGEMSNRCVTCRFVAGDVLYVLTQKKGHIKSTRIFRWSCVCSRRSCRLVLLLEIILRFYCLISGQCNEHE